MEISTLLSMKDYGFAFVNISESRTNETALRITVYGSDHDTSLLVAPNEPVTTIHIDFPSYITYSVTYDDYTLWDEDAVFQGESFRLYQQSSFMDSFIRSSCLEKTIIESMHHYGIHCIEHSIEVLSTSVPTIKVVPSITKE